MIGELQGQPVYERPAGSDVCFAVAVDVDGATPGWHDDIPRRCVERGNNAHVFVSRSQAQDETCMSVRCVPSRTPSRDCPFLDEGAD